MFSGKDADKTVPKWKQFYDGSQNKYLIPYDFLEDYTYGIKQDVRLLIKNTIDEVFNKQTNLKFLEKEEFEKVTGRVFRNCRQGESGCYNIILQFYSYYGCFSRDSHFLDKELDLLFSIFIKVILYYKILIKYLSKAESVVFTAKRNRGGIRKFRLVKVAVKRTKVSIESCYYKILYSSK